MGGFELLRTAFLVMENSVSAGRVYFDAEDEPEQNQVEDQKLIKISEAFRTILECLGEDVNREGLLHFPKAVRATWKERLVAP